MKLTPEERARSLTPEDRARLASAGTDLAAVASEMESADREALDAATWSSLSRARLEAIREIFRERLGEEYAGGFLVVTYADGPIAYRASADRKGLERVRAAVVPVPPSGEGGDL